ncbi:variant erythrocyte surface antigen-1 family protein [Babesia caballi]|uniref:Variant erythrocyte surface antigen-1 family protein n=1 Tax=Babesia caballi TaxID=5871 RepID=A0AAV4LT01_BABCB|nr:variant erythrocyte surface antigen-1 family protein [Babesia caballi]
MSSGQKKLTQPPKDLKEAIDWVLRVSGKDVSNGSDEGQKAIGGLAEELIKLFDKDAGEVARGVLSVMGENLKKVVGDLGKRGTSTDMPGYIPKYFLNQSLVGFQAVADYGSAIDLKKLDKFKKWFKQDVERNVGPITQLADALRKFLGYGNSTVTFDGSGIIKQNGNLYQKAYGDASWPRKPDEQRTCALIFLGIAPMLFLFLAYLYYWCEGHEGWSSQNFTGGSTTLSKYMTAIGFDGEYLSTTKNNGSQVAEILTKAFQKELTNDNVKTQSHYAFQESLLQAAKEKSSPSDSPLSCCFTIATPFITPNDTYDVQSTSPAIPSFLSYSGPAVLAGGAYGLNLGGLGTLMSTLLA